MKLYEKEIRQYLLDYNFNFITINTYIMKPSQLKLLEDLYNFIGANEPLLKEEFKKLKKASKNKKFNFPQFCIVFYSNLNESENK